MKVVFNKLRDISLSITDGVHNTIIDDVNGDSFLLSAKNIKNGLVNFDNTDRRINNEVREKLNKRTKMSYGDVLLTTVGTLGETALADEKYNEYEFQRSVAIIKPNKDIINNKYLYYLLKSNSYNYYFKSIATGAAQPCIFIGNLGKTKIEYFDDINYQKRIADILSAYDDLISKNNCRIKVLEKIAQELYKEWFVRFRFPGHETTKFENGLPVGWERKKVSTYYNTCSGGTPSRTHEEYFDTGIYPWVKTGEIKDCIIIDTEEYITEEAVKKSSAKLLPAKLVAMAMYGVNIGQLGYFDSQMTCNQACCVFSDKRNFSSKHYLFQYLKSIREYLLLISFGAAQQNLSQDLIKKIKIVMPSEEVVRAFEERIDVIYDSIKMLMQKNKNLSKQRDLLLPRLMSGKLEV